MVELRHITRNFLTEGKGRGVHEMRAANFHHVHIGFRFGGQGVAQHFHTRNGGFYHHLVGRYVHGSGISVVAALRFVHVVVGMDKSFCSAQLSAIQNFCAVGHHLVHIHVALRAGACLPYYQRKFTIQFSGQYFVTNL